MAHEGKLRQVSRFITGHNGEGKAIFDTSLPEESGFEVLPDNMAFALSYTTKGFPVDMGEDKDIKNYEQARKATTGLTIPGGTVLRHVDFPPSNTPVMHRTVSLDYGVVLEGEIYCVLDSGEERHLKRGDVCVQRGTMHAWKNASSTEWCRMLFVLQPSLPLEIGSQKFSEDLGNAVGIPESK